MLDNIGFGEISYSIMSSSLHGNVAFLDKKLISLKPGEKSFNQAVKRFFKEAFKGTEVEVLSTKDTINLDQIGKYLYTDVSNVKRVAVNILDDMIRVGKNKRHSKDLVINGIKKSHAGLDASNVWDYYDTKFVIDNSGIISGAEIVVRKSKNGKDYFYDINKIREVGYQDVNEFNPAYSLSTPLNDTTIPQDKSVVNSNIRKNDIKYSLNNYDKDAELNNNFWDEWINKAKEYGVIPKGENPTILFGIPHFLLTYIITSNINKCVSYTFLTFKH